MPIDEDGDGGKVEPGDVNGNDGPRSSISESTPVSTGKTGIGKEGGGGGGGVGCWDKGSEELRCAAADGGETRGRLVR